MNHERVFYWMLDHPYDALLAFSEATNADTYGIPRDANGHPKQEIPAAAMRNFLRDRISELMEADASTGDNDAAR